MFVSPDRNNFFQQLVPTIIKLKIDDFIILKIYYWYDIFIYLFETVFAFFYPVNKLQSWTYQHKVNLSCLLFNKSDFLSLDNG